MAQSADGRLHDQYQTDGVVFVPGLIDQAMMQTAERLFDWSMRHPGGNAAQFDPTPASPGRFFEDILFSALGAFSGLLQLDRDF